MQFQNPIRYVSALSVFAVTFFKKSKLTNDKVIVSSYFLITAFLMRMSENMIIDNIEDYDNKIETTFLIGFVIAT